MIIKTYTGDGSWDLRQSTGNVRHLGAPNVVSIPDRNHDFWADERFPTNGVDVLHILVLPDGKKDKKGLLVRWVVFTDPTDHQTQMIVANTPIFICNDRGDTVESLRA